MLLVTTCIAPGTAIPRVARSPRSTRFQTRLRSTRIPPSQTARHIVMQLRRSIALTRRALTRTSSQTWQFRKASWMEVLSAFRGGADLQFRRLWNGNDSKGLLCRRNEDLWDSNSETISNAPEKLEPRFAAIFGLQLHDCLHHSVIAVLRIPEINFERRGLKQRYQLL